MVPRGSLIAQGQVATGASPDGEGNALDLDILIFQLTDYLPQRENNSSLPPARIFGGGIRDVGLLGLPQLDLFERPPGLSRFNLEEKVICVERIFSRVRLRTRLLNNRLGRA